MGVVLEHAAVRYCLARDLIQLTPGIWTQEGWYPFFAPVERVLVTLGWARVPQASFLAMFIGMALSDVVCAAMMWSIWRVGRRTKSRGGASCE
jgi:hypothetical protein